MILAAIREWYFDSPLVGPVLCNVGMPDLVIASQNLASFILIRSVTLLS